MQVAGMALDWTLPVKTDWMRSQAWHEPSMNYAKDIYKVASRLKDFTALEVGAAWGFSTLALLEAGAKHLTSVDPNQSCEGQSEAEANGYTNYVWNCVRSDHFWKENTSKFDLVYIDGSHLYEDVKNDLYEGWKITNKLMLVDDWDHKNNQEVDVKDKSVIYGVSLACWEFFRDHKCKIGIEGRVLWFQK